MATTIITREAGSIAPKTESTSRDKAHNIFRSVVDAAKVDSIEVFNSQGYRFLCWNRWQGIVHCEEPLAPRAANSRHNRRRK